MEIVVHTLSKILPAIGEFEVSFEFDVQVMYTLQQALHTCGIIVSSGPYYLT